MNRNSEFITCPCISFLGPWSICKYFYFQGKVECMMCGVPVSRYVTYTHSVKYKGPIRNRNKFPLPLHNDIFTLLRFAKIFFSRTLFAFVFAPSAFILPFYLQFFLNLLFLFVWHFLCFLFLLFIIFSQRYQSISSPPTPEIVIFLNKLYTFLDICEAIFSTGTYLIPPIRKPFFSFWRFFISVFMEQFRPTVYLRSKLLLCVVPSWPTYE